MEDEETKPFGFEAIKSFFHLIKKRILGEFRYICERYFWRAKARKGKKKFVARRKGDNLNESLGMSSKKNNQHLLHQRGGRTWHDFQGRRTVGRYNILGSVFEV